MKIQHHYNDSDVLSTTIPMGGTLVRNQPDPQQVRAGKTRVYDFIRDDAGALVSEVSHEGDLKRFLSLVEAFAPYGADAEAQARADYGWTGIVRVAPEIKDTADGQPPVIDEFIDDDDDEPSTDPADARDETDTDDEGGAALAGNLPEIPPAGADGDAWMAYGKALPGVANPKKHDQLDEYAKRNYGVDLDQRKGTLYLLKQIAELQASS